jgi:sucrose-6-phosphate hydrolase SacC (GH32 family)
MFKVKNTQIIDKHSSKYLSFPDIIKSPKSNKRFFLVYREGDNHLPKWSSLILLRSDNNGITWTKQQKFSLKIEKEGYVWNCPRLSYIDGMLYIICDQKNGIIEKMSQFKTVQLVSATEGQFFEVQETAIHGMVPDKVINFKENFFCANHVIKNIKNNLIQLISWSRDRGKTWYDTNIMANNSKQQFCEASVVNMDDYLIAYLRDNSGHKRNIYTVTSKDGIHWSEPHALSIFGQRVTAIRRENKVIGVYRNTDLPLLYSDTDTYKVSMFEHNLENDEMFISHIDWEYPKNQYHFGYTGIAQVSQDEYLVVYYIQQNAKMPFIKLAFVEKTKTNY